MYNEYSWWGNKQYNTRYCLLVVVVVVLVRTLVLQCDKGNDANDADSVT